MKFFLHAHSDLGKFSSVGVRTEYIARECYQNGILKKALCRSVNHSSISLPYAQSVMPFFKELDVALGGVQKYVSRRIKLYKTRQNLFDMLSENKLDPTDIYHMWQIAPKSLARAKEMGAKTVWDVQSNVWKYSGNEIDYVFAPSKWLVKEALKCGYAKDRILYNPLGVDPDFFQPGIPDLRTKRYLYAGLLAKDKGVRELLLAWKKAALDNAVLVLCGRPTLFFYEQYKKINPGNVELLGFLDHEAIKRQYDIAYTFLIPSHREGGCKVTYEALSSGLPVVASERAGSEVKDGVNGFIIDPADVDQLSDVLEYIHGDEGRRSEMAVEARRTGELFTWEAYAKRTVAYYDEILRD